MKLGIAIEDTWDFFHDIYYDLKHHHEVTLFKKRTLSLPFFVERTNRYIFNRDFKNFLLRNDVVFFEWASELLLHASKLQINCGIVTRIHRYEMYQWIDRIKWGAVDRIIFVSEAKRREFIAKFPQYSEKALVIYEGIDPRKFTPQTKEYSGDIGILCHMYPRKRVYELILDFYELIKNGHSLHLHIGGESRPSQLDYWEAMHSLVRRLDIENRVTFYGPVSDTVPWYRKLDIFISNSYSEGLQIALLEAMASGCYCLSHCWEGIEELLPAENIFYTGRELQSKLLEFSNMPEAEKIEKKNQMRGIVEQRNDINDIKKQIRQVIEGVSI